MAKRQSAHGLSTLCVHAGQRPDPTTGAAAVPIFQTASYAFQDSDHAADLFNLRQTGNIYTRIMNPTTAVLEERIAALEGGVGALATSSGQAAVFTAIATICGAGDSLVSSAHLYGGTYTLFDTSLRRLGISTTFVDAQDPEAVRRAIADTTRAVYIETIANPRLSVPDIQAIACVAHEAGVPLIIDNTFASPALCRPFEHGADIVVHSTTKYISGHGTTIGGIVVDSGKFDWSGGRFPGLCEPDPSYHGISYVEHFGDKAFITKARLQGLRDLGACQSPFNSFLLLQGLETLALRMERHSTNGLTVASYLQSHPQVRWVSYPLLGSHPSYGNAQKYLPRGAGGMIAFGIKGGTAAGKMFVDSLSIFTLLANVGDAKSLVIHPASTTHQQLTPEQQQRSGVTPDLIRLSIGIEDPEDLICDIEQALTRVAREVGGLW